MQKKQEKKLTGYLKTLKSLVADYLVTDIDEPMENVVGKLLTSKR